MFAAAPRRSNLPTRGAARAAVRLAYEAAMLHRDMTAAATHLLNELSRLTHSHHAGAMTFDRWGPRDPLSLAGIVDYGWPQPDTTRPWRLAVEEHGVRHDPVLDAASQQPGAVHTVNRDDLLPAATFHTTLQYNEYYRPLDMHHQLFGWYQHCATAPSPDARPPVRYAYALAFVRGQDDPPYTERERRTLAITLSELLRLHTAGQFDRRDPPLPPRQAEVLALFKTGLSEKEIAAQMGISPYTVRDHVNALYRRFGVTTRAELLALFVR